MNALLSYEEAVKKYLAAIQETRLLPSQPSKRLSTRRGKTWRLRNVDGLIAKVTTDDDMALGKGVE